MTVMDTPTTSPCGRLILLPGLDGTGRLFQSLQEALDPNIATVVASYPVDLPLGYHALCEEVVRDLPSKPHVVVAESFSSPIALKVAARKPPGLRALVLSAGFVRNPQPWLLPLLNGFLSLNRSYPQLPIWLIRASLTGQKASEELCTTIQDTIQRVDPKVIALRLHEVMRCDVTDDLRKCPIPIFYLNATEDRVLGRRSLRLISRIAPNTTVIDVPGPHLLLQAEPEICAHHIKFAVESLNSYER